MFSLFKRAAFATLLAAGLVVTPVLAQSAQHAPGCAPHKKITEALSKRYQERQSAYGLMKQNFIIELFVSKKGSWTLTRTDRRGSTCIMASGHSWEHIPLSPGNGV